MLNSANKAAENFNCDRMSACACISIKTLGSKCGSALGHLWIKGSEVELEPVRNVTTMAAKSQPLSSEHQKDDSTQEILEFFLKDPFLHTRAQFSYISGI